MRPYLRACVQKNIRGGMARDQALAACTGADPEKAAKPQASTKRRKGPLPNTDMERGSGSGARTSAGSSTGEFNSKTGLSFGPIQQPYNIGGRAPTGVGVGTGNTTGAGAMTASRRWLSAAICELRALLRTARS